MTTSPLRVLLVDDNPDDRTLVARELEREFRAAEVLEAIDQTQLDTIVAAGLFDLVITDFQLRWSDGLQVLRDVRAQNPDAPVIMFTGTGNEEVAVQAMLLGLDDYIVKSPAHFKRLVPAVKRALAHAADRRERDALQAELRTLFHRLPAGVYRTADDGTLLYANAELLSLLGYAPETDPTQLNVKDCFVDPAEHARGREMQKRDGIIRGFLARIRRPDGSTRWVEDSGKRVTDERGNTQYFEGVLEDVTLRVEAESARARLAKILEVTPDFVGTADAHGRTRYVNRGGRRLLGIPDDEDLSGVPIATFHTLEGARTIQLKAIPAARAQGTWRGDVTLRTRDGTDVFVSQIVLAHYGGDGAVEYYSTVARDITKERSLQAQLHHAQKMEAVGRLAGGVSHDFNNLLTVVLAECELALADSESLSPELRGSFEAIRGAAARGALITRHLLAFSRQEHTTPTIFDPNRLIADLDKLLQRLLGEDMTLERELSDDLGRVQLDRGSLEQVLVNLIVNARDAMPDGGRVTIETRYVHLTPDEALMHGDIGPGEYVCITVRDTGTGMTAEVKERLFEPFFTTKAEGKGTGLGLATSYAIAREAGGHISVYSELGMGSTFRIYLPQAPDDVASGSPEPVHEEVRGGSESILLVEDDPMLRTIGQRMLERLGYRVTAAEHGDAALGIVHRAEAPADLLFTDVVLPGMGGHVVAEHIRAAWPGIKVLFASGYSGEVLERHKVLHGEEHLLRKPFTITDLARKVREVLDH